MGWCSWNELTIHVGEAVVCTVALAAPDLPRIGPPVLVPEPGRCPPVGLHAEVVHAAGAPEILLAKLPPCANPEEPP